jgi:hypothetical protein
VKPEREQGTGQGTSEPENGPVIDFGTAAPQPVSIPTRERIALETHWLRLIVAGVMMFTFVLLNLLVLWGVYEALQFDFKMISTQTPDYERFVNTTVISSLLGATTVQLGAAMFAITKFLFPSRP